MEATRNYRVSNYAPVFAGLDKITFRQGRASATGVSLTGGVSVNDTEDGVIDVANVSINKTVQELDALPVGTHKVSYSVTDSDGNTTTVEREIEVLSNGAPVFTIDPAMKTIKYGEVDAENQALLNGVSVSDDHDQNLTITVSGTIDKPTVGNTTNYVITYTVTDSDGNTVSATRTYTVTNDAPVFTGLDKITFRQGRASATGVSLTDGVSVNDTEDGVIDITNVSINKTVADLGLDKITFRQGRASATGVSLTDGVSVNDTEDGVIDITNVSINKTVADLDALPLGTHKVEYSVMDSDGNTTAVYRDIEVLTNEKPKFEFDFDIEEATEIGIGNVDNFDLLEGVYYIDDHDQNLKVEVLGNLVKPQVGHEEVSIITYRITDSDGNVIEKVRRVKVTNYAPEIITKLETVRIPQGTSYRANIQAIDKEDGDVSHKVVYPGDTANLQLGEYTLEYSVEDSDGNKTIANQNIVVVRKEEESTTVNVEEQEVMNTEEGKTEEASDYYVNVIERVEKKEDWIHDHMMHWYLLLLDIVIGCIAFFKVKKAKEESERGED